MSMPALMAMQSASFLSLATISRCQRLLTPAQSVTSTPSHPVSSLSHRVSSSWLACTGMPLTEAELTITDKRALLRSPGEERLEVLATQAGRRHHGGAVFARPRARHSPCSA